MLRRSDFHSALSLLGLRIPYLFFFFNPVLSFEWAWVFFFGGVSSFNWSASSNNFFRKRIQVSYLLKIYTHNKIYIYMSISCLQNTA